MTDKYDSTIAKWDEVARTDGRRAAIHPAGGVGDEAYELSGFYAAQQVMRVVGPGADRCLLDYGCGDGRVARHLAGRYSLVDGYDTSGTMCAAFNDRVAHGVARDFLLRARVYDAVYSFAVFIHHTYVDGARMLKELVEGLPLNEHIVFALQIPLYTVPRDPENWTDVGVWTAEQLHAAAAAAGLRVEKFTENAGAFSFSQIGPAHDALQILRRIT